MNEIVQSEILASSNSWRWIGRALRSKPSLIASSARSFAVTHLRKQPARPQFVLCAHHKVLSTFFSRVLHGYALCTNRTITSRRPGHGDYSADIIFDNHSRIDVERLKPGAVGLHLTRDQRDLVVSSAFYHQKSVEKWLHIKRDEFGGLTYQEKIKSLPTMEEKLIFEIDNSSGETIVDMENWPRHPGIVEVDYREFVGSGGLERFEQLIGQMGFSRNDRKCFLSLFEFFSIGGEAMKYTRHVRDPRPDQWNNHFTPHVTKYFQEKFPRTAESLIW
jgi:hypothetical protein